MKQFIPQFFLLVILSHGVMVSSAHAIYDPLSVPNNRFGVHILEPAELPVAAKLVNSSGGKWGYVTIPIRTDDRDTDKWAAFMISARQNTVIPILRISSYANGDKWVSPPYSELVDFANFLNELPWPTKNRYIVIYNEPNHSKEWGGYVDPGEYANLLIQASDIFKSRSQDFFIISAGLDMSAPSNSTSLDALRYYSEMTKVAPNWYQAIDGLGVHAYPNPSFMASPYSTTRYGITSYTYELSRLKTLGFVPKPIFITETGYVGTRSFWTPAFTQRWTDPKIVAITPFLLFAGAGDFTQFSLLDAAQQPKPAYTEIHSLSKSAGSPLLTDASIAQNTALSFSSGTAPSQPKVNFIRRIINFFFPSKPTLTIGSTKITVEIVSTPSSRAKGLSGRKSLPENSGMLFNFSSPGVQTFWMKDMRFALDFIWINSGRVVKLHQDIPPPSQTNGIPEIVYSEVPITQVLEVPSGFVAARGISIGDAVVLNSN